tara:strand:+ start:102 stop:416 length:315 start_codon:yes stop_codon:yes gene_type:complete
MNKKIFQLIIVIFLSYSISLSLDKLTHAIYHQNYTTYVENCILSKAQIQTALSNDIALKRGYNLVEGVNIFYDQYYYDCANNFNHQDSYNFLTYIDELFKGRTE